ncbi:MAG: hypothetical protein U0791_19665 [Gemmataceae bacterium]
MLGLLRKGVAISIVDVVTTRQANLYAELLASLRHADPTWNAGGRLETWSHTLEVGKPLPTLPLWLSPVRVVTLDLEPIYEKTCDDLSIS